MALDIFRSGTGILELPVNGTAQTIFQSCCGRFNNNLPNCNLRVYSATVTVTNDPVGSDSVGSTRAAVNNPDVFIYITPFLQGSPINLDCTNNNGVPVLPGNSKTVFLSVPFDEIRVSAIGNISMGNTQRGSYNLSIGACTA